MTIDRGFVPKLAKKARLRWDARCERHVLLYPERGLALNEVGAAIVELADGTRTVAEIVDALAKRYGDTPRERLESDVVTFLERLAGRGLLSRNETT